MPSFEGFVQDQLVFRSVAMLRKACEGSMAGTDTAQRQ